MMKSESTTMSGAALIAQALSDKAHAESMAFIAQMRLRGPAIERMLTKMGSIIWRKALEEGARWCDSERDALHPDNPGRGYLHQAAEKLRSMAEQEPALTTPAPTNANEAYQRMFEDAICTLARIDEALGIGKDGIASPDKTLAAIANLQAGRGSITLSAKMLRDALEFVNPDGADDPEQEETEVTIQRCPARISLDQEPMPAGMYAWLTEYPEEGCYGPLGVDMSPAPHIHDADTTNHQHITEDNQND